MKKTWSKQLLTKLMSISHSPKEILGMCIANLMPICWVGIVFMLLVTSLLNYDYKSKEDSVYVFHTIRTEVKLHSSGCSQKDWENAIDNYAKLCQRLDEIELSDEERREVDNYQQGAASSRRD